MTTSKVRTSAGSTIGVCVTTLPSTYDVAGFSALTYVTVNEVVDLGTLGKTYTVTKFSPLGSRQVVKRKGSYDNGTLSCKAGYSPTDPGQVAIQVARDSDTSSSFKLVTQSGSTYYFTAQTSATPLGIGTVDQVATFDFTLDLDSDIVATNLTA